MASATDEKLELGVKAADEKGTYLNSDPDLPKYGMEDILDERESTPPEPADTSNEFKVKHLIDRFNADPENFKLEQIAQLAIVEEVFDYVDRDNSGNLSKPELCVGMEVLLPTVRAMKITDEKADEKNMARLKLFLDNDPHNDYGPQHRDRDGDHPLKDRMEEMDETEYMNLKVFITFRQLRKILKRTLPKLHKRRIKKNAPRDQEFTLTDLKREYLECLEFLIEDCNIEPKTVQWQRFVKLLLDYLSSLETINSEVESSPWLFERITNRLGLVLFLPLLMAYGFLSMIGDVAHLCKRCRCSCVNCLRGWLILALAPLLAIAAILFGYGSIANVVLISLAARKTDGCQLSPIEGYLPILLMVLLSGSVVNFMTNYGSEEDKPFTSVYFDKTVALWDHVVLVKKLPCHGQDIDVRVTEKPQSPFLVIEYLQSKTEDVSHYQYILTFFGVIGAAGHALIPGIFRRIDGQGFACDSSDAIVYWTVIINVVVSFVAITGLTTLLAALVEKAMDAQQQVTLAGALISSSSASANGLDRWLGCTTRRNLLGWMLIRDYIVKSYRANGKNDAEVINPLVLYMIIMMLIVFIHLITNGIIDILVVVGLWDVCFLAVFVMGFLFPALFTNTILKVDHPRAVRQVRWTVKKQLNDAQSLKTKSLEKFKPEIDAKEQRALNRIEARILTKQNHLQLLDGALTELKEADVEVKILGFPVTESLLANMATLIGTGVSAISAKLSQSST